MALWKLTLSDARLAQVLEGRQVPLFCSARWNEVLEAGLGARAAYYVLADGDVPVTALSGVHLKLGPVRMFYANIPYGGLIGDAARFQELIAALDAQLRSEGVHEVRIVRTSFDRFEAPAGYTVQEAVHHPVDLATLDFSADRPYPSAVMRNVRRARLSGVEIRDIAEPAHVDRLHELYTQTMQRHGAPSTWTGRFLHTLYERIIVPGHGRMMFAWHGGRIVAGLVLIFGGETTYYFLGASESDAADVRPNDLLFYEALRQSAAAGARVFDFMTSRLTDEGLIRFKEKWGGRRQPFWIHRAELSPLHARLWDWIQRVAGSRPGAAMVRWIQRHR